MRSPSGQASVVGNGGCCCAGRLLFMVNGCFEAARTWEVIAIRSGLFSMKDHQRTETRGDR
jgi:hypothetical protein